MVCPMWSNLQALILHDNRKLYLIQRRITRKSSVFNSFTVWMLSGFWPPDFKCHTLLELSRMVDSVIDHEIGLWI